MGMAVREWSSDPGCSRVLPLPNSCGSLGVRVREPRRRCGAPPDRGAGPQTWGARFSAHLAGAGLKRCGVCCSQAWGSRQRFFFPPCAVLRVCELARGGHFPPTPWVRSFSQLTPRGMCDAPPSQVGAGMVFFVLGAVPDGGPEETRWSLVLPAALGSPRGMWVHARSVGARTAPTQGRGDAPCFLGFVVSWWSGRP